MNTYSSTTDLTPHEGSIMSNDIHYSDNAPSEFRVERPENVPLVFDGWLLGHVDSRDMMSDHSRKYRDRWADVYIYRTTTNKWVTAQIGRTREAEGRERAVVRVCETPAEVLDALKHREGYLTKVNLNVLEQAIDVDPDLEDASEERI